MQKVKILIIGESNYGKPQFNLSDCENDIEII